MIEERCHKSWLGLVAQLHVTLLSRKGNNEILWFFFKFLLPSRHGHTINFCGVIKLLKFEGNILIFVWGENSCLVTGFCSVLFQFTEYFME